MPPTTTLLTATRAAALFRPPFAASYTQRSVALPLRSRKHAGPIQKRWNSSPVHKKPLSPDEQKFPTQDQLPHVNEEASAMDRILQKEKTCDGQPSSPELEQGSPVEDILKRDKEGLKHMPKVMQDQLKKKPAGGSRSFSTSSRSRQQDMETIGSQDDISAAVLADMIKQVNDEANYQLPEGLKFDMPVLPSEKKTLNFRKRYDSMQDQFTKMLMQDGKLARAQKNMSIILDHLRTSSPPNINPRRPLVGGPPAPQLPLDPVRYLTYIIDSVAPLFRIRQQKGIAGGGTAVQIPHPLTLRQRRRAAIKWILDASEKRRDAQLANRVANELVAVAEGRSGVWDRRDQQHKIGISGRANLGLAPRRR